MIRFCLLAIISLAAAALIGSTTKAPSAPVAIEQPTPAVGQPQPAEAARVEAAPVSVAKEVPARQPVTFPASNVEPSERSVDSSSATALSSGIAQPREEPVSPAVKQTCPCNGDCCKCDTSRQPYYYSSTDRHYYACKMFTPDEAAKENARLAQMKASAQKPVGSSPNSPPLMCRQCGTSLTGSEESCPRCGLNYPWTPRRAQAPVPVRQPYAAPMQSGGCANGQCGVGGFGRSGFFRLGR